MAQTKVLIDDVLNEKTWLLRENANTQMSPSLLNLYLASQAKEEFVLKELYSKEVVRHHRDGSIYIHTLHDPFKPYCLPEDSVLIFRDEGEVKVDRVENLIRSFKRNRRVEVYTPDGFKKLEAIYEKDINEVEKFLKITTSNGFLWVTGDHRLITEKGIKRADEISVDDILFKLRKMPPQSGGIEYLDLEKKIQDKEVEELEKIFSDEDHIYTRIWKFPKKLEITEDLMKFLGLYLAEGHHRFQRDKNNDLVITLDEDEIIDWLKNFAKIYQLNYSVQAPTNRTRQTYIGSGLWLVLRYGLGIEAKSAGEKEIPSIIFNIPLKQQNAFLRGLFSGDGGLLINYDYSQIMVTYTTTSKVLAQQLYILLLSKGFDPRVIIEGPFTSRGNVSNRRCTIRGRRQIYRVLLSGYSNAEHFYKTIGFIDTKRMRRLREYLESHSKYGTQWIEMERDFLGKATNCAILTKQICRTKRAIQEQLILKNTSSEIHKKVKVKKVEEVKKYGSLVYDLQIESPHTFYTGLGEILVHNCNGLDARVFLLDGLKFPHCRSAPAKHFISAVYQSMAFIFYSQLFFSGAQAIDYYNWFLAPYLRHDRLDYTQVKEILQGFVFQLNQSNRTGAQSAFSNVGMRIKCPPYLRDEPAIFAGRKLESTYSEFEPEARMIYKALMDVMGDGDGSGAPFTFPILTTAITKDFDWDDELVDITMQTTSKTGAPYFLNFTTDYLDEKYVHALCCRLLCEHAGGVWQAGGLGVGSNKVVTLSLPHIALMSKNEKKFFSALDGEMEVARKALKESNAIIKASMDRWKILPWLKMKTDDGAPYYNYKERRLTFGMIGLNECLLNLIGEPLTSRGGLELGLKIVAHMDRNIKKFSKRDKVVYTLEQTPAESLHGEEKIPIIRNEELEITGIGSLVDSYLNGEGSVVPRERLKAFAVNNELKVEILPITRVYKHKRKSDVYEVTLESNREVKITDAHSVFTFNDGKLISKPLNKFKLGDWLVLVKALPWRGKTEEIDLINYIDKNRVNKITKDKVYTGTGYKFVFNRLIKVDEKMSFFLGALIAEGSITNIGLEIRSTDEEFSQKLKNIADEIFGYRTFHLKKRNKNYSPRATKAIYTFGCYSRILVSAIEKAFDLKRGSKNKEIPSEILKAIRETVASFLDAYYFSEGSITINKLKHDREVRISSKSKKIIESLHFLFSRLGIVTRCKVSDRYSGRHHGRYYDILVRGNNINEFLKVINKKEIRQVKPQDEFIPNISNLVKEAREELGIKLSISYLRNLGLMNRYGMLRHAEKKIHKTSRYGLGRIASTLESVAQSMTIDPPSPKLEEIKKILDSDLTFERIKSIKKMKEQPEYVYDIEVGGNHNFINNLSILLHNSASHKLAQKDRSRFGKRAHTQGKGEAVYYSNSSHVPYKDDVSFFDKVQIEAEFHPYFTGGAISHFWIGETRPDPGSLKNLVQKMCRTKLAYFAFSPDFSICSNDHYHRGKLATCPECGAKVIDYISRVVGYFTRVSNWNPGKQREYQERKRFEPVPHPPF